MSFQIGRSTSLNSPSQLRPPTHASPYYTNTRQSYLDYILPTIIFGHTLLFWVLDQRSCLERVD